MRPGSSRSGQNTPARRDIAGRGGRGGGEGQCQKDDLCVLHEHLCMTPEDKIGGVAFIACGIPAAAELSLEISRLWRSRMARGRDVRRRSQWKLGRAAKHVRIRERG
jgi:hypothetical protein